MSDSPERPTRGRLVEAALELFWIRGYRAASPTDGLREAEAHGGSLYRFFPSKERLAVAVLEPWTPMF